LHEIHEETYEQAKDHTNRNQRPSNDQEDNEEEEKLQMITQKQQSAALKIKEQMQSF